MKFTLDRALKKGIEAHKSGKVQEADRFYTAILKANPKHADANHNMGVLAVDIGKLQQALPFFKAALEANPSIQQFWFSYINALIKLDRMADAKAVFNQAKSKGLKGDSFDRLAKRLGLSESKTMNVQDPPKEQLSSLLTLYRQQKLQRVFKEAQTLAKQYTNSLALWNLIGASAAQIGKLDQAVLAFKKALLIKPDYAEAHYNMGNALKDQGKLEEALEAYKKALSIKSDYVEAYLNIGNALKDQGKLEEALEAFNKALSIKSDYAEAYFNMGNALHDKGKLEEAIAAYKKVLFIKPDYAEAYLNMGNVLKDQEKLEEAIKVYNEVLTINPGYAKAYLNMGNALHDKGKLEEAIESYNKALSIKPGYAEAYLNMGNVLKDQEKLEEAIKAYNEALLIKPDYAEAYTNMSFVKLRLGKLPDGIKLREWRWKTKGSQPYFRNFKAPKWDGSISLQDKTLLVWGEQGPGDIIIWCSCLNYFVSICANIIVECPPKLVKLLSLSFPKITFRSEQQYSNCEIEDFDFQVPMETLFGYACLSGKITDDQASYIIPNNKRVEYWAKKLRESTQKTCIGISWKSPVMTTKRSNNYADLSFWKPLLQNKNYKFFNLQSSDFEDDLQRISRDFGVDVINFDEIDHYNDLDEVAAFCKALDMSISVATAVATISAAVGAHTIIPTWKQSSWNNVLLNSRGPKVDLLYRNTWETWDNVFNNILESLK